MLTPSLARAAPTFTIDAGEVSVISGASPVTLSLPIYLTGTGFTTPGFTYQLNSFGFGSNISPSFLASAVKLTSASGPAGFSLTSNPAGGSFVSNQISLSGSSSTGAAFQRNSSVLLATLNLEVAPNTPYGVYAVQLTNTPSTAGIYTRPDISVSGLGGDDSFEVDAVLPGQITIVPEPTIVVSGVLIGLVSLSRRAARWAI
jgi:hypothetical protein